MPHKFLQTLKIAGGGSIIYTRRINEIGGIKSLNGQVPRSPARVGLVIKCPMGELGHPAGRPGEDDETKPF
jgi:hypothetical protein